MTTTSDLDRLVTTWLEDGGTPDLDPERLALAFATTAGTRQRRRPLPIVGPQAWPPESARALSVQSAMVGGVAAMLLLVAGLVAVGALRPQPEQVPAPTPSASATPTPTPSPTPPSSGQAQAVPDVLRSKWIGGPRPVPSAPGGQDDAALHLDTVTLTIDSRSGSTLTPAFLSRPTVDGSTLTLVSGVPEGCAVGDVGTYAWTLSPGGTVLELTAQQDECAGRAAAVAGTWYRVACKAEISCIGTLEARSYPSWNFATKLDANHEHHPPFGALTYTVPEGWTNSHDFGAGYWLEPTPWYDALVRDRGGQDDHDRPIGNGIYVMARPVAAIQDDQCTDSPDPSVGETADDLVAFLVNHPALEASSPRQLTIGGRPATAVDLQLRPDWTRTCPGMGDPIALLFVTKDGSASNGWNSSGVVAGEAHRYVIVDLGGGRPVLIDIAAADAAFDALATDAEPVIETFRFIP